MEEIMSPEVQISRPPSRRQLVTDMIFRRVCLAFAWLSILLVVYIVLEIAFSAAPTIRQHGWGFLSGRTWDSNKGWYSILPEIWGTLYSSVLALLFGSAFAIAAAIFLSEGFLASFLFATLKLFCLEYHRVLGKIPEQAENLLRNLIELLAAIPSVVYGLWGLYVVIPLIRPWCNWLHMKFGWLPIFGTNLAGPGMLPAALVLSIMVMPTIAAISRDALAAVPSKLRMAAYGLGATRWETILAVIVPTAARGIFGGIVLAFGRALGETMALAMLVGNANQISVSLFSPANTLSALVANTFPEARPKDVPVLMYAALVLLAITLLVNVAGETILERATAKLEGGRS
jgi:phosphate transport system permease protein